MVTLPMEWFKEQIAETKADIEHLETTIRGMQAKVADRQKRLESFELVMRELQAANKAEAFEPRVGAVSVPTSPEEPITYAEAARQVLREANGDVLTTGEIWERMKAKGVSSSSKQPARYIGQYAIPPEFERVGIGRYCWVSPEFREPTVAEIEEAGDRYIQEQLDIARGK